MASITAAGNGAPGSDMFAVGMHSHSSYADEYDGNYDIEELV